MPRYVVLVQETKSREVTVLAPSAEAAEDWALDNIGFDISDPSDFDAINLCDERTASATEVPLKTPTLDTAA